VTHLRRTLTLCAGGATLLLAACGYPDATASSGPAATTEQTTPTPLAGADSFSEGAGIEPTTFPDGLKWINLKVGTGPMATRGDVVRVHYTGWLANGTKFDSSRDSGQPFDVTLGQGQTVQGFEEGILGMQVGGRRRIIIPPALGYGDQGQPPTIPPKSTLDFTVELVAITGHASPSPSPSPSQ
jgi:FKBP-type peptidyl-prolyl cis-trans isomerase